MKTKVSIYRDTTPGRKKIWLVRWYGDYDPKTGKHRRYSKGFALKRDAEAFQRQKEQEFAKGGARNGVKITLSSFCESVLEVKKSEVRLSSLALYDQAVGKLIDHFGPDMSISKITPVLAAKFVANLPSGKNKPLAQYTRLKYLTIFKSIFQMAVYWHMLTVNPFASVKRPKTVDTDWYYLQPKEYFKLLDAAPTIQRKAIYALMYTAGLRLFEVLNLTLRNIDFENWTITLVNRAERDKVPPFHLKDSEARTIPIPKHTVDILTELAAHAPEGLPFVVLTQEQNERVLHRWAERKKVKDPRAWDYNDFDSKVTKNLKRLAKEAGIKVTAKFGSHTLRKSCIQTWANNLPPSVVQELAGHADIKTTLKYYTKVTPDQMAQAAAVFENVLAVE